MRLARSAAERCAELTRGLLAFSRMLPSDLQRTSVNEVVHDTAALLARMVPASIQVRLHLAVDLPEAMVDSVQLQQVLFNLFVNARDAMPEGGTLTVRSRRVEIAPGDARGLAAGPYAEISISDTGVGIPPDVLPRIFEPFFTTKPVGSGTGLGLAMVYGIVSQHQGRVEATSEPGWGSTFRVLLPAAPGEARSEPGEPVAVRAGEPERRPAPPLEGLPVLVVDDEPLVRGFTQRALEVAGCRVTAAADGEEGLRAAREAGEPPAVVLMDLTMPGRPVREVLRELHEFAPATPVVLTSGFSQHSSGREELPGLPFLPKPYSPAQLVEAIRAALEGAPSRAS
jgi:CheY-like chemotaxis protein